MSSSKNEKTSPAASVTVLSANPSTLSICAPSCSRDLDVEKADGTIEVDEAELALAHYVVPVLEKGVKTALSKPTSPWVRFRVWYNPYRMVSLTSSRMSHSTLTPHSVQLFTVTFALNMVVVLMACLRRFPYAEKHGAAIALGNIVAAVACRNELFLRAVFWVVVKLFQKVRQAFLIYQPCSNPYLSQWTPLWFRIFWTAFLQHIGGIHSGCATASLAWFIFVLVRGFQNHVALHTPKVVLAWGVIAVTVTAVTLIAAAPWIRHYHHK